MKETITWAELKHLVDQELEDQGLSEDTPIISIDMHEDRDDDSVSAWIEDGMLYICSNDECLLPLDATTKP